MGLLTLVRHGQASFLQDDYDQLSALGERQARMLGEYWVRRGVTFDHVYHGPARRQIDTGKIVADVYRYAGAAWPAPVDVPEFDEYPGLEVMQTFLPGLLERHDELRVLHEEYRSTPDRKRAARAFEKVFQRVTRLWVAGELESPDVETWQAFCERVERGIAAVRKAGGRGVLFSSGGVMAVATRLALDLSPIRTLELSWSPRNASFAEFMFSSDRFSLHSFNVHPHLESPDLLTWR